MRRIVNSEKKGVLANLVSGMLIGLYRFCKKHRLRPYGFIARTVTKIYPDARYCIIELYPDVHFRIDLLDGYWTNLLLDHYEYEPEILTLLGHFSALDYAFIDCGANYGLWSLIVSSRNFGQKAVIAIEPVSKTYSMLEANKNLNQRQFPIIKNIIEEHSGKQVAIKVGKAHAGASVYFSATSKGIEEIVETTSIDDLMATHRELQKDYVILKLDVEGAEIPALKGARQLLSTKEVLVIYEDHGMDTTSQISDFLIHSLSYKVYFCDEAAHFSEMRSTSQISALKTNKVKGYNFIAVKPFSRFDRDLMALAGQSAPLARAVGE